ncbi:hypothetical protein [Pseudonocardia sp. HH130630-07]|uniref:hypothetical protein n=1 Tax=Pseudonocardia sp. HH130630-07 TaxID=1690815 RepID=UPI000814B615|nr:hypothetical protein [Pseudonocardia sp. HH130630-07]ANY10464.1 hypothetical protein AFB00_27725 [Pseudonocardia sp. HH130630-07]
MIGRYRRRWQQAKVRPGDGSPPAPYRFWQLFSRSMFVLELPGPYGRPDVFEVDVRYYADSSTTASPAALYRNGVQVHRSRIPVVFPVPGGCIEVATSAFGLKRIHYVRDDGHEEVLRPHPRSHEGLRARFGRRFPRTSSVVSALAVCVLLAGLAVALPKTAETLTHIPVVAEHVGAFTSPVRLPVWATVTLAVAGAFAALERALTLRHHWLLDMHTSD